MIFHVSAMICEANDLLEYLQNDINVDRKH